MSKKKLKPDFIPLKKKIALNIFSRFVKTQTKLHELTYLFWECTLRCNINCLHCGSDCKKDTGIADMPATDFLNVTKSIKEHYDPAKIMIVLTGGEPLLRKDLEYCGRELKKQGYSWGIVTNGFQLSQNRFVNLLSAGLRAVTLSVDGLEESHNWLRGNKASFKNAIAALDLIVQTKNLNYDVVSCINNKNIDELKRLKDFLILKKVKAWRLFTIAPIGRAKENQELFLSDRQIVQLMEFIKMCRSEDQIKVSFSCEAYVGIYENEVRDNFFFCRAGINIGSILADGSISACPNIDHSFIQGNIYNDNFIDIWKKEFKDMRNRDWTKKGECETCYHYKWCLGNGLHLRNINSRTTERCFMKSINNV